MPVSVTVGKLFNSVITSGYTPRWVSQVYATDLNLDGNSDLIVLGASYPSNGAPVAQPGFVAFGNGAGGFTLATETQFPISTLKTVHPREVIFADFNGDGRPDVYVANHGYDATPYPGEQNLLYLSNANGTWRDATSTLPQVSDFTHGASAGDVNGDGYLDIVVGNIPQPNPVDPYLLLNDGSGRFTRSDSALPTGTGQVLNQFQTRMSSQLLSDLDKDGLADLVVGSFDSTASKPKPPFILWNTQGVFNESNMTVLPSPKHFGTSNSVYDIQSVDLNGDGRKDLIIAYQKSVWLGGWELQVLINEGNRSFSDQTSRYIPEESAQYGGFPTANSSASQYWVQFVNLIDLNGDGRMDFVLDARGITSAPATLPLAYVQQADGSFQVARVSELASGLSWFFGYTTQAVTWSGQTGFARLGVENGVVKVYTLPTTFAPILPVRTDFSDPVKRFGTSGDDALFGGRGGDTFKGGSGNDSIDGGLGIDTAVFSGNRAATTITMTATGYTVSGGTDGSDTLTGIERLQFTDAFLAFDLEGNAGQTYRLYQAAFNRTPDLAGLGGWIAGMDGGLSLSQVANSFMASAEFQSLYGANPSNTQFVALLYSNALHRTADAGGLGYWVNQLTSNLQTRAQALVNFSESTENKASVQPLIANGIVYANAAQAAGPARGQSFTGTAGADSLIGSVGNDNFNGGAGNDSLNGGAGIDSAIYSGNRASYTLTLGGSTLTVAGGADGTDTLTNIERIRFADTALAFDTSGNAGQTYRLYQAAFNRTPDKAGLSDWIRGMDSGQSLSQVATGFIGSDEFKGLYGATPSNTQFVDLLYANVLRRAADAAGSDYWLGQMQGGTTRETVLIGFSESAENQAALIGVIQGGIAYTPG